MIRDRGFGSQNTVVFAPRDLGHVEDAVLAKGEADAGIEPRVGDMVSSLTRRK
jgi:hypothetical protein